MNAQTAIELDDGNFQFEVLQSDQPVLVEFSDSTLTPCPKLDEILQELAAQYDGRAKICHMDTAANWNTPCALLVEQLPAVLVFQYGRVVDRFVGEEPRSVYCRAIDETLTQNWVI